MTRLSLRLDLRLVYAELVQLVRRVEPVELAELVEIASGIESTSHWYRVMTASGTE